MPQQSVAPSSPDRRRFLAACSAAGISGTLLPGVLLALAASTSAAQSEATVLHPADVPTVGLPKITPAMVEAAEAIAAISLTPDQRSMLLEGLSEQRNSVEVIRSLHLPNSTAPAFLFDPVPAGMVLDTVRKPLRVSDPPHVVLAQNATTEAATEALAFFSVRELAELVRTRRVTSTTLTRMYLARLKRFDPKLRFVINLTEERALKQASAADAEIAAGKYRGPLHGIPWGAKDLLAVKGYPTTWGAAGFEHQTFDEDATVVEARSWPAGAPGGTGRGSGVQ